jgi:GntR family transcriptional regulator
VNTPTGAVIAREHLLEILGQLPKGGQLPGERTLAISIGVSRMTLRRAIDLIIEEGLIERHPRSGTFITKPILTTEINYHSFAQEIESRGMTSTSKIVFFKKVKANRRISTLLKIKDNSEVFKIQRIRFGDGIPIAIEKLFISAAIISRLERKDVSGSLYKYLAKEYGIYLETVESTVTACLPDVQERMHLQIDEKVPCLRVKMVDHSQWGEPFMIAECTYRSDRFNIKMKLSMDGALSENSTEEEGADYKIS